MTGDPIYRKTQIAWPTILTMAAVAAILIPVFSRSQLTAAMWIVAAGFALSLLLFSTLTVTVTSDGLVAAFGVGLVRKTLKFADIVSFSPVRNSWMHGWGIHYFPGGMVFNASGFSAVEFRVANGRYVRIGTPEPEALAAALRRLNLPASREAHTVSAAGIGARNAFGLAIGGLALVFAGWTIYSGFQPPDVQVSDEAISIRNGLYRSVVPYDAIRSVELESGLPRIGLKTNGFAARNLLRGNFRVYEWGPSRLYINADVPPFVVIQTGDTHVVVNFADPERTRRLYADLRTHMARGRR